MNTPIYDFITEYISKNAVRAHMPGHKGKRLDTCLCDITEVKGADSLFEASGIIAQSEENAARLFGAHKTLYSASGSTPCICATLAMTCNIGGTVLAVGNSHISVYNAGVLLGLDIVHTAPDALENAVLREKPSCVFVTSPDYFGHTINIEPLALICKRRGIPLAVDNAHGAYLAFMEPNRHPLKLGADLCCDSAHKTLPVLTGGAYLHIGNPMYSAKAKETMRLFASTSPSYLVLQSLDLCNAILDGDFRRDLALTAKRVRELKESLHEYDFFESEPLKLVVNAPPYGYSGVDLAARLRARFVEPEYADSERVLLMFSACNMERDFERVFEAFCAIPRLKPLPEQPVLPPPRTVKVMTLRDAFFADSEDIDVRACAGRVCSKTILTCPPGIPLAVGGERFSEESVNFLKSYGVLSVNVVK